MKKTSNIALKEYRKILKSHGCKKVRTTGGHEHWTRSDLNRPITFQSHIDPVPEFIVKQHIRILGLTNEDFLKN